MANVPHRPRSIVALLSALLMVAIVLPNGAAAQSSRVPPWRAALPSPPQEARIAIGGNQVTVQLAITADQQSLGLGYRNGLAPGTGMLFVFDAPRVQTFWMKGMRFCLDIVWVTGGKVVGAAENACPDPAGTTDPQRPVYTSPQPVQNVLEIPGGWLRSHGYGTGTPVDLSAIPAAPAASTASPRR